MHEMSICESLMQVVEEQAHKQGFRQVKTVYVEIGAFAGIEPEAMQFCFDAVCRNTIASGAKLEIIQQPGLAWCFDCQKAIQVWDRFAPCPTCSGIKLKMQGGEEMRIKELEVL